MSSTGLVLDACFERHDTGPGHPERPARLRAIRDALHEARLDQKCRLIPPQKVDHRWLLSNHEQDYLDRLQQACASGQRAIDCADSAICPDTFEVAELAAGSVLAAVDAVAKGELANAFCAVRPPGHHAEPSESMGFCLFNNVAIAAKFLLEEHAIERVLILDWDVHHGNGTQHSFEEDPRVFFCSLHGHPDTLYPGTGYEDERGRGRGEKTTMNLTMMPGSGEAEYREAFCEKFLPAARAFRPNFILISAGFDAHRQDPLAQINLETSSFEWLTRETLHLASECCQGKVVSSLEGGYDLDALAECTATHLECLLAVGGRQ